MYTTHDLPNSNQQFKNMVLNKYTHKNKPNQNINTNLIILITFFDSQS